MGALRLAGASRPFRNDPGVQDLDLEVATGEIVALVGLNGAGKTTLLKLALGMLRPVSGRVTIGGIDVQRMPPARWRPVGHFVDGPALYPELTVMQNLRLAASMRSAEMSCVGPAIERFGLERYAQRRVRQLSLGNRQRAGLAAALQHSPSLLVLDEPGNGLDPAGVLLLRDEMLLRRAHGAAVLISSHHLDEVARIADRIVVMNRGRLIGELDTGLSQLERAFFERVRVDDLERGST